MANWAATQERMVIESAIIRPRCSVQCNSSMRINYLLALLPCPQNKYLQLRRLTRTLQRELGRIQVEIECELSFCPHSVTTQPDYPRTDLVLKIVNICAARTRCFVG